MQPKRRAKQKPTGTAVPHHVPAQVFHLAQIAALRDLTTALSAEIQAPDDVGASSTPSYIDKVITKHIDQAWQRYCLARFPAELVHHEHRQPNHIIFSQTESIPVAVWNEDTPDLTDAWGMFLVTPENSDDIVPLTLTSLFQPIDPKAYPPGTLKFEITDARHTALAVFVEILYGQNADVARLIGSHEPALAWRQVQVLRSWYASVAGTALEFLPRDQLRDWSVNHHSYSTLAEALLFVARNGLTVLAQKGLAFSTLSQYYTQLLDLVDDQFPSNPAAALQAFHAVLSQDHRSQREQLDLMNGAILSGSGQQPERYDYFVTFPDNTKDLPKLLAFPKCHFRPDVVT